MNKHQKIKLNRRTCWLFAILVILAGTALKLNGSSMEAWRMFIQVGAPSGTLLGTPKPIRSDEWAVFTPMILSQYKGPHAFSAVSDIIRGGGTDVGIVYGLPIRSLVSILFRPFLTGYLVLPPDYGMAFFWCARLVLLWMVWFEIAMLLTDRQLLPSLVCAFLVAFSPLVQWWFAVNGLVEMLIFGGGAVLLLKDFLSQKDRRRRLLCLPGLYICAGGYAATLYPPQMIPLFYVFLALAILVILKTKKGLRADRWDWIAFALTLCALAGTLAAVWLNHADTIRLVMNSAYPGARRSTGGGMLPAFFSEWGNLFFPFDEQGIPANACESAAMLSFFPLGLVLCAFACFQRKRVDPLCAGLMTVWLLISCYCAAGLPDLPARITLLDRATPGRAIVAAGLVNILLLTRGLSLLKKKTRLIPALTAAAIYAVVSFLLERSFYGDYLKGYRSWLILLLSGAVCLGLFCWRSVSKWAAAGICVLALIFGGAVNPIQTGCTRPLESDTGKAVSAVVEQDPSALWAVEGVGFPINNYLIMFGAPSVNSTSVYPEPEKWGRLDPESTDVEIYNRYAHIQLLIRDQVRERFRLLNPDYFSVELTVEELAEKLGVKYVLSPNDLSACPSEKVAVIPRAPAGQYMIWELQDTGDTSGGNSAS